MGASAVLVSCIVLALLLSWNSSLVLWRTNARTYEREREIEREGGDSSGQMSMRVFVRASAFVCSSTLL